MKTNYVLVVLLSMFFLGCTTVENRVNGIIEIGMSKKEVVSILGEPDDITSYPDCSWCNPDEEIWFYKGIFFQIFKRNKTIIFKNDVVSSINERHWTDK